MQKRIKFTIQITETDTITVKGNVELPEDWFQLSPGDQREYLTKPVSAHMHPGQILYTASLFQLATGVDEEIFDFDFEIVEKEQLSHVKKSIE